MEVLVFLSHIYVSTDGLDMSTISELLSRHPPVESIKEKLDGEPDVVPIDDQEADEVFATLSSATARSILATLYAQPQTASDIADDVDTSIQNVHYHLNNLQDAGLIEVAETWYSNQGTEMKVYAPTNKALVLFAGDDLNRSSLLDAIKRLVGIIGIFALVSLVVDILLRLESRSSPVAVGVGGGAGGPATYPLPPGLVFFLGSLLAIVVLIAWEHFSFG